MAWSELHDADLVRSQALIDGDWCNAADGRTLEIANPASQQLIALVPNMGVYEAKLAINAAAIADVEWKQLTGHQRAGVLRRWLDLIIENMQDLAWILTAEQGKPLHEAIGEIRYAASFVEWFAEQGKRVIGEVLSSPMPDKRMFVLKQPVGVCAAITPWNFPAAMITRKVAPALAAGCTMIVKPTLLDGGRQHRLGGNFFEPTVLGNVSSSMLVACEETFGPVSPLIPFTDESTVIGLANNTEYGLAAYIYSRDINRVWRVAEAMQFGMVGVNTGSISTEVAPFGGIK
jgi:acyl-CoA reductase-like NAD-dependent aldehyde dehydrogenase